MSNLFKIIAVISLTIHASNYLTTRCEGMDWIFPSEKKPIVPKKFDLTLQNIIPPHTPDEIDLSLNFGFVSEETFEILFKTKDSSKGYICLFSEIEKQAKNYQDLTLHKSKCILSLKSTKGLQKNHLLLNQKMTDLVRIIESIDSKIKNPTIGFVPIISSQLEPAGYINFGISIIPHEKKGPIEINGQVLDFQIRKKFDSLALTSSMNKIEFNFTEKELNNQTDVKKIHLSLTGYSNAPKYIDSSSTIRYHILNEKDIKIDSYKAPEGKSFDCLIIKKDIIRYTSIADLNLEPFKKTPSIKKARLSYELEENTKPKSPKIKKLNLDFKTLGIGGLTSQLDELKDALISRGINEDFRKRADFEHTKGIILYGPPGTGKTLIARKMAEILGVKEKYFKIINGPEILSKYVGESEKNMRELFELAEDNPRELIVLFFDEIDAIASRRSTGNGVGEKVGNNIVNQMLSKMDGVDSIKNILVIGATNRLDMIDPALIRPGRFDLKLCIDLPDEMGRRDIFDIHLKKIMANTMLKEVNPEKLVNELALKTQNFTGAEIKGLCDTAKKLALQEVTNPNDLSQVDEKNYSVTREHFLAALKKTNPAFGQQTSNLEALLPATKIVLSSQEEILTKLITRMNAFRTGHVSSLLITGNKGSGKSTIAGFFAEKTKDVIPK